MSAAHCPRTWQAEADLDGYLSRADAASFERHVATCAECSAERAMLARVQTVAKRMPTLEISPLRRRALHNELLHRANKALARERRPVLARSWIWLSFAACAVGVLLVVFLWPQGPGFAPERGAEPSYKLVAAPGSRWHVARTGSSLRLALEQGTFTLSVNKLKVSQRFALDLPDGELEVRGTRFSVRVDLQHTRRVAVEEGRVALRLAGHVETMLGPGDTWPTATPPELVPSAAADGTASFGPTAPPRGPPFVSSSARSALSTGAVSAARRQRAPSGTDTTAPPAGTATPSPKRDGGLPPPTAGEDFARAMTMFSRGDYGTAEQLLDAFEARYPDSSHAEDVLFLRALTRSRRGDEQGASRLAREYVRRFPAGFRIQEAEKMAHEPLKNSEPSR